MTPKKTGAEDRRKFNRERKRDWRERTRAEQRAKVAVSDADLRDFTQKNPLLAEVAEFIAAEHKQVTETADRLKRALLVLMEGDAP